jgi:hypothetical protein
MWGSTGKSHAGVFVVHVLCVRLLAPDSHSFKGSLRLDFRAPISYVHESLAIHPHIRKEG